MQRFAVVIAVILLTAISVPADGAEPDLPFRVQKLTDRVVLFTELSPWESNHVVIAGADGLVLVDSGHSPLMGRLIRQAVSRELGRNHFAYVIDTHGHWGHTWGNAAFPEALVIGHERAAGEMRVDDPNVERTLGYARGQLERIDTQLATLDPAGEEAREARLQRDHFDNIVKGVSETGFEIKKPQLTFSDRLSLDLGDVTLEMSYLGPAHSNSDIIVLLPEEKVLLMGCFFLEQGPLPVFGAQAVLDPDRWIEVLDSVLEDENGIRYVVLGQHTVWPRERLVAMRDYIAGLWTGIRELDAEGVDFETALTRLPVPAELGFLRDSGASEEQLAQYQRLEAMALWRQVKESAAAAVGRAIDGGGAAAAVARYRELAADDTGEVFFDEAEFNLLGYRLLGEGRVDEAIAVFQLNVERFPDSWNVYDSLGEALAARGDTARAVELYRRSLELNPENANAVRALERLAR